MLDLHSLIPILAFTLVNLDDALLRSLKEAMRELEPAADEEALTILAVAAARGQNEYVHRPAPSGMPQQISAVDENGDIKDFIFICELADGEIRHSLEAVPDDTPGGPIGGKGES